MNNEAYTHGNTNYFNTKSDLDKLATDIFETKEELNILLSDVLGLLNELGVCSVN